MPAVNEAPSETATTMFHIGIHVTDLARSVHFYRLLLGVEPAKHFDDYAKFELSTPPLVLALYPSPQEPGGALNHVGLRFPDSAALVAVQRRLEEAGIATQRQEGVECCYARQTKFWVSDPDKTLWEVYTLHEDIDHSGFDDPPVPPQLAAQATWQHRLTEPFPERIPHADGTLDQVLLEGTYNMPLTPAQRAHIASEAFRVLKPGGMAAVHGLVSDVPLPGRPQLPGLASMVSHVPTLHEPLVDLRQAGFTALSYEKLGEIHCFQVAGIELHELRLVAYRPLADEHAPSLVIFKGPYAEATLEDGTVLRRGENTWISASTAGTLRCSPFAGLVTFLETSAAAGCQC